MPQVRLDLGEAEGRLPPVCMVCGAPARHYRTRKLTYWPRWTLLLLIVHPGLWGLAALAFSKRATVRAPFCDRHQGHWSDRRRLIWGVGAALAVAGGMGVVVASQLQQPGSDDIMQFAWLGISAALFSWLMLIAIVHSTEIVPALITKTEIVLKGVSEEFVEAIQEADRARFESKDSRADAEEISQVKRDRHAESIQGERRNPPPHCDGIEE